MPCVTSTPTCGPVQWWAQWTVAHLCRQVPQFGQIYSVGFVVVTAEVGLNHRHPVGGQRPGLSPHSHITRQPKGGLDFQDYFIGVTKLNLV